MLQPQVITDANGNGAEIFVWAFKSHSDRHIGRYVHNIVW